MFTARYFNPRYWAVRFWAKVGEDSVVVPNVFLTANIQIAYSTNIDLPVFSSNKKVSYTSELGG